ncbi:MAG: oligosaccharide flippase family protein [Candidatus Methanomethylicaceae archaeon]
MPNCKEKRIEVGDPGSPFVQIGKDILFYVPARVIPVITSLLSIAAYTRLLDPKEYGWLSLTMATVSFVNSFAFGWLGYVIWRYFEKYKKEQNLQKFLSTVGTVSAILFLIVTPLWYLVTLFFSPYLDAYFVYLLRLGILVLGAQVGANLILTVLQVQGQSLKYSLYTAIHTLGTLSLAVSLIYFLSWGVEAILLSSVIFMGGIVGLELHQFYKRWRISPFYFSSSLFRKFSSFGLPQIGISVGALILSIFDRYMIEVLRSTEEVGIYSAGYTIADMCIQIPLSIMMLASLPIIVQTYENRGEEETRVLFKSLFSLYLIILVPAVFGIVALSQNIVEVLLGQSFGSASAILPWVAGGSFFFGFSQYSNTPFQLKEKPNQLLYLIIMAAILNIVLNFLLIPPLGILGAAYATFLAYLIYLIVSYLLVNRIFPLFFPWKTLSKAILASVGMYLILSLGLINLTSKIQSLMINITMGSLSYFVILLILREETIWRILFHLNQSLKSSLSSRGHTQCL